MAAPPPVLSPLSIRSLFPLLTRLSPTSPTANRPTLLTPLQIASAQSSTIEELVRSRSWYIILSPSCGLASRIVSKVISGIAGQALGIPIRVCVFGRMMEVGQI
ncbi:hypothetical protein B9Z19DRAFT_1064666 [Tuber borchii]|uniref:Uncharacterized protein n=1 Tax=Tuber borchii TaxID=42251 RepID=A0A2T6ZU22_TUBBO|nr:hypothetical protein B9Z19DRAFT_1064666 [Tuber borchii]